MHVRTNPKGNSHLYLHVQTYPRKKEEESQKSM